MDYSINKVAMYEAIADKLEQMILNDETDSKSYLPSEQVLASGFGTSRPVIREALKLLKERGLIELHQGGRTVICEPGVEHIVNPINRIVRLKDIKAGEIFEIRIALETLSAALAARNATKEDVSLLKEVNNELGKKENSPEESARLDVEFHRCIANIADNTILSIFISTIEEVLVSMIKVALNNEANRTDGTSYHNRLISAIEAHDCERAETIMREHLMLSMRNYEGLK